MSISALRDTAPAGLPRLTLTVTGEDSLKEFNRIICRALSTDAEAAVAIRQLADLLAHGAVLQDYTRWSNTSLEEAIANEVDIQTADRHAALMQFSLQDDQEDSAQQALPLSDENILGELPHPGSPDSGVTDVAYTEKLA